MTDPMLDEAMSVRGGEGEKGLVGEESKGLEEVVERLEREVREGREREGRIREQLERKIRENQVLMDEAGRLMHQADELREQMSADQGLLHQERTRGEARMQEMERMLEGVEQEKRELQKRLEDMIGGGGGGGEKERGGDGDGKVGMTMSPQLSEGMVLVEREEEEEREEMRRMREKLGRAEEELSQLGRIRDERDAWRSSTKRLEETVVALEGRLGGRVKGIVPAVGREGRGQGDGAPAYEECCPRCVRRPILYL
ncbi:MAG: hypothetical protein DHS80DRAFT_22645 [Piptocephalis tieghemiana]|nr:MAG: hypothetical protein DHS80DRAFT_22645 [Piptocephalis tieghemiana]